MEKQVKGYTRKGKNGKTIVVKAHTRKCEGKSCAAGAGSEFSKRKHYEDDPKTPIVNTLVHTFGMEDKMLSKRERSAYEKKHGYTRGGKFQGKQVLERNGKAYTWDFFGSKLSPMRKHHSDQYFARRNKSK